MKSLTKMLFGIPQLPECESVLWMNARGIPHPHIFKYSDILASPRDTGLCLVLQFSGRNSESLSDQEAGLGGFLGGRERCVVYFLYLVLLTCRGITASSKMVRNQYTWCCWRSLSHKNLFPRETDNWR